MRAVRLTDFSGGISETFSADDFAADSVSEAKGFVLESAVSLRSQWPLQSFGSATDWLAIRGFSANSDYLLGIKTDGTVWWTLAPAFDAPSPSLTWNAFASITTNDDYKFIGEIPYEAAKQTVTTLVSGETTSVDVVLYGKNGMLLNTNPLTGAPVVIYESAANTLSSYTYTKTYPSRIPHPTIANLYISDSGVMPRANCGILWGDKLVLGDIEWFASTGTDQTLGSGTVKRYKNALWFSDAGAIDTYDPLSVVVPCSAEAQIVGLAVIDTGLLIFTTNASGRDGVILLRGSAANFRIETLRTGLNAPLRTTTFHRSFLGQWADTGTVVFIDRLGGVWHTNGSGIVRLDGDTIAPYSPATERDHVATVGPWLFASRGGRLLCFRSFGGSGAWTELVLPTPVSDGHVDSLTAVGNAMFFLMEGKVYRFAVGYDDGPRGLLNGATVLPLRLSSATLSVEQEGDQSHRRALWHRVGVRASGQNSAKLTSIETTAGPALAPTSASYQVSLDETVGERFEYVTQAGIGYAVEASASFGFTGDIEVESMTFWVSAGEPSR